ncbi:MAG: MarR family winged helix-turn-helix transcriptional regulator [Streptosporangiaceae bacterium]
MPTSAAEDAEREEILVLLVRARGGLGNAISAHLAAAGFDDLPRNGPFVLGGMIRQGGSAVELIRGLGVTRQAASQLIDTLVLRGYLSRGINPDDRRRMNIVLTERGRAAAAAIRAGIDEVEAELAGALSPDELAGLRAGLAALGRIRERTEGG